MDPDLYKLYPVSSKHTNVLNIVPVFLESSHHRKSAFVHFQFPVHLSMVAASHGCVAWPSIVTVAVAEILFFVPDASTSDRVKFDHANVKDFHWKLYRVEDCGCVGEKFFDGLINFTFYKRMKRRLQEAVDFYKEKVESDEDDDPAKKMMSENLLRLVFCSLFVMLS